MIYPEPVLPARAPQIRPRPATLSEAALGFQPQRAVRWLAPRVLITTGLQSLVAGVFGSFADKRELQGSLPAVVHRYGGSEQLWLDHVADVGDGFDATYSVASLLAAESLEVPVGETALRLPRGQLLVMGGDQVYPAGSTRGYEDRTKGVYRAALPTGGENPPTLFALPGNHDWYDGLTAFLRVFTQRRPFGGWLTEQTRSYFAVELPHRWWLFAIDTQFDDYVDAPQLAYFRAVAAELRAGDAIILCTAKPAWVPAGAAGVSKGYDTLEFFNREIIRPRGAAIRLMVSGDTHHYARYAERGGSAQRITCGLGGAYLAATHELPDCLVLPPARSRVRDPSPPTRFDLAARYPSKAASAQLATGILRLPWRNPGFWLFTGIAQTVMTLAMMLGLAGTATGVFGLLATWAPATIVAVVLVLAGVAFARIDLPRSSRTNTVAGLCHASAHLALSFGWALTVGWLDREVLSVGLGAELGILAVVAVGTPVVIGFLDAELVAAYLLVASRLGINLNEVFAGQSIEDHKGFLRMHIGADGELTVYPIELRRVCRTWRVNPAGRPSEPWLLPADGPLCPRLIEEPVRIPRAGDRVSNPSVDQRSP